MINSFIKITVLIFLFLICEFLKAQTSGPVQAEFKSFTPAGDDGSVDLSTGDFKKNILLFELPGPNGGYPFNLSYRSGITVTQEASWVGCGFNLNPGNITRSVRGIPDDFNGDDLNQIHELRDMEPNRTYGFNFGGNVEIYGGDTEKGFPINPSLNIKMYYNNYRGFGYSRKIGLETQLNNLFGINASISDDSQDAGLIGTVGISMGEYARINAQFHSIEGLNEFSFGTKYNYMPKPVMFLGYSRPWSIPSTGNEMEGQNYNLSFKYGPSIQGIDPAGKVGGFYSIQKIKGAKDWKLNNAYGYLYLDSGFNNEKGILDFNREKDGPIRTKSPNIATPVVTNDLYSCSGNGNDINFTFRAFRSDIPILFDKKQESDFDGYSLGVEVGGGWIGKLGVNAEISSSNTTVSKWNNDDDTNTLLDTINSAFSIARDHASEKYFFKMIGEQIVRNESSGLKLDPLGDYNAVRAKLNTIRYDIPPFSYEADDILTDRFDQNYPLNLNSFPNIQRVPRSTVIQKFTNGEIKKMEDLLPGFIKREEKPENHIGGFIVTTTEGIRYVYGLPVYNMEHEEHEFSIDRSKREKIINSNYSLVFPEGTTRINGTDYYKYEISNTDKYLYVKKLDPYITAYLLTAVLGSDYVDADTVVGPSDPDMGYWIKFNYKMETDNYKWRSPFIGAKFNKRFENGANKGGNEILNDKGNFIYGRREVWSLSSAESKSHISVFHRSVRADAKGANSRLQNDLNNLTGESLFKLDSIALYSKIHYKNNNKPIPIKKVHFKYDYSLCQGIPNFQTHDQTITKKGKLTLTKVWFTYKNNTRGAKSPYIFSYDSDNPRQNPAYDMSAQDRWGTYRKIEEISDRNDSDILTSEQTYTSQIDSIANNFAKVWQLKNIVEPSGRKIKIDYEADTYSYCQTKPAMRMFNIMKVGDDARASEEYDEIESKDAKIYFKLEKPILGSQAQQKIELEQKYIPADHQLFFKVRISLKDSSKNQYEYVSGYAKIKEENGWGVTSINSQDNQYGWIQLKKIEGYHPFSIAAYQHLRIQQPELIKSSSSFDSEALNAIETALKVLTMIDFVGELITLIKGTYKVWYDEDWGKFIKPDYSWIRLKEPDGIKYGGGSRVARITINDNWSFSTNDEESESEYGWVYEYLMPDSISSGVASYEPFSGGDENSLRYAKIYKDKFALASDYNLFFEGPVNESYYPSPMVGYQRVKVFTLQAYKTELLKKRGEYSPIPVIGPSIYEFYTAKDFPTITDETKVLKKQTPIPLQTLPVPFLGVITLRNKTASQGYSIITNDMPGKPRSITHYQYTDSIEIRNSSVKKTEYHYYSDSEQNTSLKPYFSLNNNVSVSLNEGSIEKKNIGEDFEFFIDMRENRAESWAAGISPNLNLISLGFIPFPIVGPWPNVSYSLDETRTIVTNKIIHKTGILKEIIENNEGSISKTKYEVFDGLTGNPILTSTTNQFNNPIYNYNIPARWKYERMGHAYYNSDFSLSPNVPERRRNFTIPFPENQLKSIYIGDEYGAESIDGSSTKAVVTNIIDDRVTFNSISTFKSGQSTFRLIRSGNRNLLNSYAGNVTSLSHPINDRGRDTCEIKKDSICASCEIWISKVAPSELALLFFEVFNLESIDTTIHNAPSNFPQFYHLYSEINIENKIITLVGRRSENTCRIVFINYKGDVVDPLDIDKTTIPVYRENPPFRIIIDPSLELEYSGIVAIAKIEGLEVPQKLVVLSDCDWWTSVSREKIILEDKCKREFTESFDVLDKVLNISAIKYSDYWEESIDDIRFNEETEYLTEQFLNRNDFEKGVKGIWRPSKVFMYLDNRKQSNTVNLREDGCMDNVMLFDWYSTNLERCAPKWKTSSELRRYSPYGFALDNWNLPNVFITSLYGYNGSVQIASAINATNDEIGYEGFEEYQALEEVDEENIGTGNISFCTMIKVFSILDEDCTSTTLSGQFVGPYFRIENAKINQNSAIKRGGIPSAIQQILNSNNIPKNLALTGPGLPCSIPIIGTAVDSSGNQYFVLDPVLQNCPEVNPIHPDNIREIKSTEDLIKGFREAQYSNQKVKVEYNRYEPGIIGPWKKDIVLVTDYKAHTGKNSLLFREPVKYTQKFLKLINNRQYFLSVWVSCANTDTYTFKSSSGSIEDRLGIQIIFLDKDGAELEKKYLFEPDGHIIEGWQKIDGSFKMPQSAEYVVIEFQLEKTGTNTYQQSYFDDIRVFPYESNMKTYVYDTQDYSLIATLNENNYAELYSYDEEGNLYLTRKETYKGIQTVAEYRSHLLEH